MEKINIKENLSQIKQQIAEAEIKSGRKPGSVKLMAVSKFHPSEDIIQAINSEQFLFGENRVQEAKEKFTFIRENISPSQNEKLTLHLIGQLQTNKVKNAVSVCSCIQSVDRLSLVEEIEKQCAKIEKSMKILLEIHTGEESKSGFTSEEEVIKVLDLISDNKFPHLKVSGFMTMAPFTENEALIHKSFESLRTLQEKVQSEYTNLSLSELSMGMSGDYKIAIAEGSTMVRVGTAIFGERNYN